MATNDQQSLRHLQAEIARIDVKLRRAVSCWQNAGQDVADVFRGLYVSDDEAGELLSRPLCSHWGEVGTLPPREEEAFAQAADETADRAAEIADAARQRGHTPRLVHLATTFGLDALALDTLLICLAPALDLRYERLYGYLQDDVTRRWPGVNLILDLLCKPGPERLSFLSAFADDAPLFKNRLLARVADRNGPQPLLRQILKIDEAIVAWLYGRFQPHADLAGCATLSYSQPTQQDELLAYSAGRKGHLHRLAGAPAAEVPLILCHGPDKLSQDAAARLLAARWQRPLLTVDLAAALKELEPLPALQIAIRDARLHTAVLYLTGWNTCLNDGETPPELLTTLLAYAGPVIAAGHRRWLPRGSRQQRRLHRLAFPTPNYAQRLALWRFYLDGIAHSEQLSLTDLAGQFQLTTDQIRDAVALAQDTAVFRDSPIEDADLLAAARAYSNPNLASLATQIRPRYGWKDIVLPPDQLALLREILNTIRQRPQVLDAWELGRKLVSCRGVTILFSGPPGTGKTMAAEILAGELGLDLYKIDLSTVVSKYIGETEKNLERIFREAESSNAILFFDEADALFGKRSEVRDSHDRYANIEISYLLQRMEAYDGVTILATNLRANLDEAFTRRLQFAVDFPFPDADHRQRIWQALFPALVPRGDELDFAGLSSRYRLAGGNIRNILVSAAYLAAADGHCITMAHLLQSTRRELQKMGRLVNEEDLRL